FIDESGRTAPSLRFLVDRSQSDPGDRVVLRVPVAFGLSPVAFDPTALLEPHERRIQRALVQHERMVCELFKSRGQSVRVERAHRRQGPENDQIQGAGKETGADSWRFRLHLSTK